MLLGAIEAMSQTPSNSANVAEELGLSREEIQKVRWIALFKKGKTNQQFLEGLLEIFQSSSKQEKEEKKMNQRGLNWLISLFVKKQNAVGGSSETREQKSGGGGVRFLTQEELRNAHDCNDHAEFLGEYYEPTDISSHRCGDYNCCGRPMDEFYLYKKYQCTRCGRVWLMDYDVVGVYVGVCRVCKRKTKIQILPYRNDSGIWAD